MTAVTRPGLDGLPEWGARVTGHGRDYVLTLPDHYVRQETATWFHADATPDWIRGSALDWFRDNGFVVEAAQGALF